MTTSLAAAPNLEQIKKQAKELLHGFRAQSPDAIRRIRDSHPDGARSAHMPLLLSDCQLVIAREYGFPSWPKLKREVDRLSIDAGREPRIKKPVVRREDGRVWIDGVRSLKWGEDRETTFCGALSNALAVTAHPFSYEDLMGLSGLAFRTRWFQGNETPDCCPSSPVGEFPEEIRAISRATGWPIRTGNRLDEEDQTMARHWPEIVASIAGGRPVLAYTTMMDVGIVHGYKPEDMSIIGWDYHHKGAEAMEIPVDKIGAWIAFINENVGSLPPAEVFVESLRTAVANFSRDDYDRARKRGDYRYGEIALKAWASDLGQTDGSNGDYYGKLFFVSWWNFNCLYDARRAASEYLREHAGLLPEAFRELVRKAAGIYDEERGLLGRTYRERDIFFGPWTGKSIADWTLDVKSRERDILLECAKLEALAIGLLKQAVAGVEPAPA
jgi:hypothetical protein